MHPQISIIIPAWNEGDRIESTLKAVREGFKQNHSVEIIVVDDGSTDHTYVVARQWADHVIRLSQNKGKGSALWTGWQAAQGQILVFLDADLDDSAQYVRLLLSPVQEGQADMSIAILPQAKRKGGFGLVKSLAAYGIYWLCGFRASAPLSGQRAVRREVLEHAGGLSRGFGIEVGLTIDAARDGYRIVEVEVPFRHRETGRDWFGFVHRGKQFLQVGFTLFRKWWKPI